MNESVSFMIVRHPFERLASAYKDKMEHAIPFNYYDRLGTTIVKRYRGHKRPGMVCIKNNVNLQKI